MTIGINNNGTGPSTALLNSDPNTSDPIYGPSSTSDINAPQSGNNPNGLSYDYSGQMATAGASTSDVNAPQSGGIIPSKDLGAYASDATQSSAPPYVPLVGTGYETNPSGGKDNLTNVITAQEQRNALHPSLDPNTKQIYNPIRNLNEDQLDKQTEGLYKTTPVTDAHASQIAQTPQTDASSYDATHGTAAQGTVDPNSLIQNQFDSLMNSNKDEAGVPDWARTAVTSANQRMNSLGLASSTMAGGATASAILSTALPMAQYNASVYATLNLQNLSNQQQAMLSNQAADNASKQFNAQSEQQNAQFFATLATQISTQNAQMNTAISQFNAGQHNTAEQFNENLRNQQEQFNIGNQLIVDQSNVAWQRTINTANTAGENAANNANAQNMFNLQQTDLNNLWQQSRDEASWALTSGENAKNRQLALVVSALNGQFSQNLLSSQLSANMFSQLGGLGVNILGGLGKSLFGGSNEGGNVSGGDIG